MSNKTHHPIQPLEEDEQGTLRFKENKIVRFLLDAGPFDMNQLALMEFPREDREQFAQLIGYSYGGFGELGYVTSETYGAAHRMTRGLDERDARIAQLESVLEIVRIGLKEAAAAVFAISPDDLHT